MISVAIQNERLGRDPESPRVVFEERSHDHPSQALLLLLTAHSSSAPAWGVPPNSTAAHARV